MKGCGLDDGEDECGEPIVLGANSGDNLADGGAVAEVQATAQSVRQQLLGEGLGEGVRVGAKDELQFGGGGEALPIGEFGGGIDGSAAVGRAPAADRIVVFEAEAEGVHAGVATGADGVGAMFFELLAEGSRVGSGFFVERGDVGRRGWRGLMEKVFKNPFASDDRARAGGIGRYGEDAGLGEDAAALQAVEFDAAEVIAGDTRDAVVTGEAFVQERKAAIKEVEDGAVFSEYGGEELFGFDAHVGGEFAGEGGEDGWVWLKDGEVPGLEPLGGEAFGEGTGFGVGEQSAGLIGESGVELVGIGLPVEFGVGEGAPKEVGQAGGELMARQGAGTGAAVALDAEEEVGGDEEGSQSGSHGLFERAGSGLLLVRERQEAIEFGGFDGPAEGLAGEGGEDSAGAGG